MRIHIALALCLLAVGVCRAEDAAAPIKLTDLKLFPDTPKGHFGKPLDGFAFPASQQRQLTILYFDKAAAGQKVIVRLVGERTTLGADKEVKQFDAVPIDAEGRIPIEIKFPASVPPGLYRIDVIKNEKIVGSAGYYVKAGEVKTTAVTAARIDVLRQKPDGSFEATAAPKAADHHLYFAAETKGAGTGGTRVTWSFTAVDTTAGKKRGLPGLDVKDWPLDNTTLAYDIELPRDWPLGKYRVSLKVDDDAVKDLDFEIKE